MEGKEQKKTTAEKSDHTDRRIKRKDIGKRKISEKNQAIQKKKKKKPKQTKNKMYILFFK